MSQFAPLSRRPLAPKPTTAKAKPRGPASTVVSSKKPAPVDYADFRKDERSLGPEFRDRQRAQLDALVDRVFAAASGRPVLQQQPVVSDAHSPAEAQAQRGASGVSPTATARPTARPLNLTDAPALLGETPRRIAGSLVGGRPLPNAVRETLEPSLGLDLGAVRVHDGARAQDAARALRARAFTIGRSVVFGAGEYAPGTPAGTRLLAHELTHVVQQTAALGVAPPVIQRADDPARGLIDQFTSFLNLDEEGLGAELVRRAIARQYDFVQSVLDDLHSTDRDDVSVAFMDVATDALLKQIVADERGRRLLDRLYDELTSGSVAEDEQKQANRILKLKAGRIAPAELESVVGGGAVKIFPFRIPGITVFNDAPINAERRPNGQIHVKIPTHTLGIDEFKHEIGTLPSEVGVSGINVPENEIVGVKLYDLGGIIKYAPALFLVELSNQTDTKMLERAVGVAAIGLTLGTGALAGLGLEASTAARVLLFADRAALAIGAVGVVIDDHRGFILSQFGAQGAEFLRVWDIVESAVALYGFARVVMTAPKLIGALRNAYRSWRAVAAGMKGIGEGDTTALNKITQATDGILKDADDIQVAAKPPQAPGANPPPPPGADPAQAAAQRPGQPHTAPTEPGAKPQRPTEPPARPMPSAVPTFDFGHEAGYVSDRIFRDWIHHEIPSEGWKIHVSANAASAHGVADTALPLLRDMGVNHKVVGTVRALERMGGTQVGKFITIYPDSSAQAKQIADAIDRALASRGLVGPSISGERAIGNSGLLYTRYGGFTKGTVTAPSGQEVPDTRGQLKPPWVDDPWQGPLPSGRPTVKPGPGKDPPRD